MNEIERKFIGAVDEAVFVPEERLYVEQGYLVVTENVEWRIRNMVDYAGTPGHTPFPVWFTAIKFGNGLHRKEYEFRFWRMFHWVARVLWSLAPYRLQKTRSSANGWEIDQFHFDLAGLVLVEAEIPEAGHPLPPLPPGVKALWEVTESGAFANKRLARMSRDARITCVFDANYVTLQYQMDNKLPGVA